MIRGLYTSAAGMVAQMQGHDIRANNLANVATPGFKREVPAYGAFPEIFLYRLKDTLPGLPGSRFPAPVGTLGTGAWVEEVAVLHSQGPLQETGRSWDFALEGRGFFVVETPQGRRYTRNGSFQADEEGWLVTDRGYRVLGRDGTPLRADEEDLADRLLVMGFPAGTNLVKEGDSLFFTAVPGQALGNTGVRAGFLEQSNVNAVTAMVEMIAGMRTYEANQRALQVQDQTLDKLINEVGRTG